MHTNATALRSTLDGVTFPYEETGKITNHVQIDCHFFLDIHSFLSGIFFALNGAFCGWPGRGGRLLRAKLFRGGAGARHKIQSRTEYRCILSGIFVWRKKHHFNE